MPAQLSQETQAKLMAALTDKDGADAADASYQALASELVTAQKAESDGKTASLAAHQRALDSAHDALAAVAQDLGMGPLATKFGKRPARFGGRAAAAG